MATYDKSSYRAKAEENVNEWRVPELTGDSLTFDQFEDPLLKENDDVVSARNAYNQWLNIHKVRDAAKRRPPEATSDGHFMNTHKQAESWLRRAIDAHNNAFESLQMKRTAVEMEKRDTLKLAETHRASEVRSLLRSMDDKSERSALLMRAVESGDSEVLGAVLDASPTLSGLERDDIKSIEQAYVSKHAPHIAQRRKAIEKAERVLEAAYADAQRAYSAMFPADRLSRIQREQQEAAEARSALG